MSPDQSVIVATILMLAAAFGIAVSAFRITAARWTWRALAAALVLALLQRSLELVDRVYYSGLNPADRIEDWVVLLMSAAVLATVALGRREAGLRRREREELARRERHLETLFATVPGPLVVIAPDGSLRDVNRAVLAMAGLDRTALLGQPAIDFLVAPEHRNAAGQAFERALAGAVVTGLELAVQVPGRSRRTIVWNAAPMPQADGGGGDVVAIGQDVTERLAAEAAARGVARLVEDSPSPILTLDGVGRLAHANPAALALRPDGPPVGALAAAAREDLPVTVELPVGDRLIQFTLTRRPGFDEVDVFGHDITSLRDAEAARRQVDARYRHIVENTQEGILTVTTEGRILYANEHAASMFGYLIDEMTGRSLFDFMDKSDAVLARDRLNRRRRHLAEKTEVRYRRKDGSVLWVLLAASPMYDENGRVEGSVGFLVDVTERRRLEQELRATAADLNERIKELSLLQQFNALAADPDLPLARICAETAARVPDAMQEPERCSARIDLDGAVYLSPRFVGEGAVISQPIELSEGRQGSISVHCRPDEFQERSPFLAEERQLLAQLAHLLSMVVRRFDAEAASRASEARYRQLVDRMNEGLVVVDPGGGISFVNPRLCAMLGVSAESMVGQGVDAFVHPDDVPLIREQAERRRRGELSVYRVRLAKAAGSEWLHARIASSPLYDADGRFEGALGVVTDLHGDVHADEPASATAD